MVGTLSNRQFNRMKNYIPNIRTFTLLVRWPILLEFGLNRLETLSEIITYIIAPFVICYGCYHSK
jgi:hypothetical protein